MKLTYGNQTIDLFGKEDFPDGPPKQIFMGLSGGLDSASLLYLICTHFPNIEVIPYAGNDSFHPMDYLNAINVNQWFQERFPNHNIHTTTIFNFDANEKRWREEAKRLMASGKKPGFTSVRGLAKTLVMNYNIRNIQDSIASDSIRVTGMSANPPDEEMKLNGFYNNAERRRDKGQNLSTLRENVYQPYINVDKAFVAGVFFKHDLMDDLFPLTGSCVGTPDVQNWGTEPCGRCWWCAEKKWAFGKY